jgi:hypothetical protein
MSVHVRVCVRECSEDDVGREFLLSYGSGDYKSEVKLMSTKEVFALFANYTAE